MTMKQSVKKSLKKEIADSILILIVINGEGKNTKHK